MQRSFFSFLLFLCLISTPLHAGLWDELVCALGALLSDHGVGLTIASHMFDDDDEEDARDGVHSPETDPAFDPNKTGDEDRITGDSQASIAWCHGAQSSSSSSVPSLQSEVASKRAEVAARSKQNEEALREPTYRLIGLPDDLRAYPIFHLRSLRQPNGWSCGWYALFNALHIRDYLRGCRLTLNGPFDPRSVVNYPMYNDERFRIWHGIDVACAEGTYGHTLGYDEVCDFQCPSPHYGTNQLGNFLEADQIEAVAKNRDLPVCILAAPDKVFTAGQSASMLFEASSSQHPVDISVDSASVIANRVTAFMSDNSQNILFFICQTNGTSGITAPVNVSGSGGEHWITIAVIKSGHETVEYAMIVMDSFNSFICKREISEAKLRPDTRFFIDFLSQHFFNVQA